MHRLLSELAGQGMAILMISSELPEVLGMADRVLVVCEGRLTADLARDDATPETVMHAATAHGAAHDAPADHRGGDRAEPTRLLVEPSRCRPAGAPSTTLLRSPRDRDPRSCWSLVIAAATIKSPSFLFSANGWRDLLLTPSILLLLAVGQAVVIITRNVDLSVGSVLGLTAYLTGRLFIDHPGLPIVAVFARGLAGRRAARAWSTALLVGFGKVPALVITLGTLYIYRGIVLTWAGSNRINASDLPRRLPRPRHQAVLSIPVLSIIALVVLVARRLLPAHRAAAAASSTRSAPTRTPPSSTASGRAAG